MELIQCDPDYRVSFFFFFTSKLKDFQRTALCDQIEAAAVTRR